MSSMLLLKNWKEEPLSPITDDNISNDEVTLFSENNNKTFYQTCLDINDDDDDNNNSSNDDDDNDNGNNIKLEDDLIPDEIKEEIASYMLEDIEKLIDLDELIKEEPYLLDEKILPILDEVDPLQHQHQRAIQVPINEEIKLEYIRAQQQQQSDNTQYLLKELETVYVELAHETLTPPQSPPSQSVILTPLEPLLQQQQQSVIPPTQHTYLSINNNDKQQNNVYPVPDDKDLLSLQGYHRAIPPQQLIPMEYPIIATTPQPDIAHELAVVDELVRTRVEDMQWNLNDNSSGPASPTSNSCSGSSNFGDYSSDDPEWVPETIENYNDLSDGDLLKSQQQQRKRSKPYSRTATTDKKSRKKEQNKNAATRYRMKKKAEAEVILSEERQLLNKNEDLENKINDMQREIKYLKGLMRDLFKAKGLIN